jgi:hypothetical protein
MDRTDNEASNNSSVAACAFVATVTVLPSRCLAMIGGCFTELLPNNNRGIHIETHRLIGGIDEVGC